MVVSWPETSSSDDLTNALQKGFGRAYLWAAQGKASADCILAACLNDYRFDRQVEDARGDWLWQILSAASMAQRLSAEVLAALLRIEESDAGPQLCQLARHYALAGDDRFQSELRRIVEDRPCQDDDLLGVEELVRLEGSDGFVRAVRRHGFELLSREWEWFDGDLAYIGIRWLGEEFAISLLDSHATADANIRRFTESWQLDRRIRAAHKPVPYRERVGEYSKDEIIAAAEATDKTSTRFRGWGRFATDTDLNIIYERMLATTNVESLRRYARVFATRPWPGFDVRFLQLCLHDDENLRRLAGFAVANNRHPAVRRFALEHLKIPLHQENSINMLVANYESGDEEIVLDSLQLPEDACHLHRMLMGLRNLVEENETARCEAAVELVYENTPCSECRRAIVKLLAERVGLPEMMSAECQFDVDPDTRSLAGGPAWDG
jgi:hypothetical protein